ncbi:MAG: peptide ABC transporter substrate-binding protein, partial [Clostridia bacterium]|nr:peptide ABC transporter substrate-binding protein [Clostridia bacterium]
MKSLRLCAFCLCFVLLLPIMSGCGDSNNNLIYLNIQSVPETLDPQLAKSDEELMICRNLFEGLLRKNKDGKIVNGVCKSYEKNGLTYTFDLREGAKWSNKSDVTADDFVFAFRRAVTPSVKAPFARRLRNIK